MSAPTTEPQTTTPSASALDKPRGQPQKKIVGILAANRLGPRSVREI